MPSTYLGDALKFINSMLQRMRKTGVDRHSVVVDGDRILIAQNGAVDSSLSFDSIESIQGVSKDMLTSDEIFVVLESGGKWYWVSEHDKGFDHLLVEIRRRFPLSSLDWYNTLNRNPPFEPKTIELWRTN